MERAEAADFIVGFFIARIPILLFQAIQAALLPKLAALAGAGKHDDFRAGMKKLLMIVVGVGVLGVVAGATIGPIVGRDPLRREVQPRERGSRSARARGARCSSSPSRSRRR